MVAVSTASPSSKALLLLPTGESCNTPSQFWGPQDARALRLCALLTRNSGAFVTFAALPCPITRNQHASRTTPQQNTKHHLSTLQHLVQQTTQNNMVT
jgi:hypothetical protein